MRRLLLAAAILLTMACSSAGALDLFSVAGSPACGAGDAYVYAVYDATSALTCSAGGGSTYVMCGCLNTVVAPLGGVVNSFETMDTPSGTDPVADSSTDTLHWTCTGLTCTGDSTTDTIALVVATPTITVEEDNSTVDASVVDIDFTEPDATLVTSSPSGEANVDMSKYFLSAGRGTSQVGYGNKGSASGSLSLFANDTDATDAKLLLGGGSNFNIYSDISDLGANSGGFSGGVGGLIAYVGSSSDKFQWIGGGVEVGKVDASGNAQFDGTATATSFIGDVPLASSTVTGAGSTSKCARFDASHHLIEASADCSAGDTSGDSITVNSSAAADANFLDGDIDWTLVGASTPDDITATVACTGCIDATDIATDAVDTAEIKAAAVTDSELASDSVTEPKLKAVDSPVDEDILTYESTTGDFEWHTQSEELDKIGSTQGNILYRNSSAWTVLAPGTAGQLLKTGGAGADPSWSDTSTSSEFAPYGQYDPSNPPSSCAVCDEFTNDTASLTWSWGNQDSSTLTVDLDSYRINGDTASNALHVRGTDTPSSGNTDFTISVKYQVSVSASNDGCGIGLIESGSIATPTEITYLDFYENGATDPVALATATNYDFGSVAGVGSSLSLNLNAVYQIIPQYLQLRYIDSTRATTAWHSTNGFDWVQVGSTATLSADPPYFFLSARDGGNCRYEWVRARTDSNKNVAGE